MKPQHLIFMLFLACLPVAAFSQIQLEGKLQVGDTSQVHTVFTTAGDRLVGRVLAFDKGTITFELKNKSQLVFQHDEIEKILVQDTAAGGTSIEYLKTDPQATTGLPFSYQIYLVNGKSYTGELLRFSKSQVRLSCEGCPSRMSTSSIKEVVSVSEPLNQMAKKPAMMHLLKTSRGDRFVGQLLKYSPGRGFSFLLENGDTLNFSEQRLQYGQLVKSDASSSAQKVDLPIEMNGQEKLMFGGTGFVLPKGKAEFRSSILFFHTMDIGVTDFLTLGAGASTFMPYPGVSFRGKLGFNIGKYLHIGAGGMVMGILDQYNGFDEDQSDWESIAAATGALTIGTRERYVNIGIMHGNETIVNSFGNFDPDGNFTGFTVGGAYRINNHFRFFAEHFQLNWKEPELPDFSSLGFSFFTLRHRLDFGLSVVQYDNGDNGPIVFPVAGYSLRF